MDSLQNSAVEVSQPRGLQYEAYWLPVRVSTLATEKIASLEVMHAAFPRVFASAICEIQEGWRTRPHDFQSQKIHVMELMPSDDVPDGIKLSFRVDANAICVADIYTKDQHELFYVQGSSRKRR